MNGGAPAGTRQEGRRQSARAQLRPGERHGQSRSSSEGVASERRSESVESGRQDVCDHPGSKGVPVIRRIALPNTRGIDGHDEIAACRKMTGHAESTVLARDIEVEVPATDAAAGMHTHSRGVGRTLWDTKRSAAIRWQPAGAGVLTSTLMLHRRTASISTSIAS